MSFDEFKKKSNSTWETLIKEQLKDNLTFEKLIYKHSSGISLPPFVTQETLDKERITPCELLMPDSKIGMLISGSSELEFDQLDFGKENEVDAFYFQEIDESQKFSKDKLNIISLFGNKVCSTDFQNSSNSLFVADPLKKLCLTGNWVVSEEKDLMDLKFLILNNKNLGVGVSELPFSDSGGNIITACVYAFETMLYYFESLIKIGLQPEKIARNFNYEIALGNEYLFEISKLRAVRWIWGLVLKSYELNIDEFPLTIHSFNKDFYFSSVDVYTNVLRMCMSNIIANIGGVDIHFNTAFDSLTGKKTLLSEQTAIHCQHILKEEGYLLEVSDPLSGSYVIEYLTHKIGSKVWGDLQKNSNQSNSIVDELQFGKVQKRIFQELETIVSLYKENKRILIGVNKFFSQNQERGEESSYGFNKVLDKKKREIKPLIKQNLAYLLNNSYA